MIDDAHRRPLSTDDLVRRICRQAATRALLAGSLAACTRSDPLPTVPAREPAAPARGDVASEPLEPEQAPPGDESSRARPVEEDPSVALPLRASDEPTLRSSDELSPFPCDYPPHPNFAEGNEYVRARMAAWDRSRFNKPARALHVASDVDFVEIRQAVLKPGSGQFSADAEIELAMFARGGAPCSGASDKDRCERALEQARREQTTAFPCSGWTCEDLDRTFALVTRGDQVSVLRSPAEFRALLGEIDSPVEAWLMVMAHRHTRGYQCDSPEYSLQRAIPGGYALQSRQLVQLCRSAEGAPGHRPYIYKDFTYHVDTRGNVKRVRVGEAIVQHACVASGRRPPGLVALRAAGQGTGALLARMAELELASVLAFRRLARELRALGAPAQLGARARAAARDEVRHARSLGRLARAYGVAPRPLRIEASPLRDLLALALDNASEGCVRELFGALVAHVQKERAADPHIAAAFREIADDEARHAALALDLDAYISPLLATEQRTQLAETRKRALRALYDELAEPSADERLLCGMPTLQEARVLFETLEQPKPTEWAGLGRLPS